MSRQVRPYQALQFFYLLAAFFIFKLTASKKLNYQYFLAFLGSAIIASLTHDLGLIIFFNGFLFLLVFFYKRLVKKKAVLFFGLGLLPFFLFVLIFKKPLLASLSHLGEFNNLFYYRVFLTHNYFWLVLLSLVGFLSKVFQKQKAVLLLGLFLTVQLLAVSFFLKQPFVRYFYVVFPFLVILAVAGLESVSQVIRRTVKYKVLGKGHFLLIVLAFLLIVGMKGKISFLPQKAYSLNEDMLEVPEVDWKEIYGLVGKKLVQNPTAILVVNWSDLPTWYLGEGAVDYVVRKEKLAKDPVSSAIMLDSLEKFKDLVELKEKGILVIDSWDDYLPEGIREYCRENLNKELEVDRLYPIQPRYWPVEVYSWGF